MLSSISNVNWNLYRPLESKTSQFVVMKLTWTFRHKNLYLLWKIANYGKPPTQVRRIRVHNYCSKIGRNNLREINSVISYNVRKHLHNNWILQSIVYNKIYSFTPANYMMNINKRRIPCENSIICIIIIVRCKKMKYLYTSMTYFWPIIGRNKIFSHGGGIWLWWTGGVQSVAAHFNSHSTKC